MKKYILFLLISICLTGCFNWKKADDDNQDDLEETVITCIKFIDDYFAGTSWKRSGVEGIVRNEEENIVWDAKSNVFTYQEDDKIRLLIYNEMIFVGNDLINNRYEELKDEYKFDKLRDFAETTYNELATCDLKQINEDYRIKEAK